MDLRELASLKNLVRVGAVSSVDVKKRTARVIYFDKQDVNGKPLISGTLKVIQNQPLIAFKKWDEDNSIEGETPDEIKEIIITEGSNPNYEGIYHSVNRGLGIGEKYAKGELADIRQYETEPGDFNTLEIYTTSEPDYIKENEEKILIKVYPWLPYIGQLVVCVYLPKGECDGFILGGL